MSKAVMISIRPEWCEKIGSGEKIVEVRKTRPKLPTPFKCYIYETQGKTDTPWIDEDGHLDFHGRGKVIGEFVCDKLVWVISHPTVFAGHALLHQKAINDACLTNDEAEIYSAGKDVYGWHISDLVIYDEPKPLTDFYKWWDGGDDIRPCQNGKFCKYEYYDYGEGCMACAIDYDGTNCPYLKMQKAPQSWCYVEGEDNG